MTVSASVRRADYVGNSATTEFSVTFQFFQVLVLVDGEQKTDGIDYTVTGGNGKTGTVIFSAPPVTGSKVSIRGNETIEQTIDLVENDPFPADTVEGGLDRLTMITGNLSTTLTNIIGDVTEIEESAQTAADNAATSEANALASKNAAAASASAAVTSETNAADSASAAAASAAVSEENTVYTAVGAGAIERTYLDKLRDTVNVLDFIPVAEHAAITDYSSTVDVSAYVQTAQDALTPTGSLVIPAGLFNIGDTLTKRNATRWLGAGHGGSHSDGTTSPLDHATMFKWIGASGGTIVDYAPASGSGNASLKGGCVTGIALDGNSLAAVGLSMKSVAHNHIDVFGRSFSGTVLDLGVQTVLSEGKNTEHNEIDVTGVQTGLSDGNILRISGDDTANVCFNTFAKVYGLYLNGDGIDFGDSDNNLILKVWLFQFTNGTGKGIRFRANTINQPCRVNTIISCSPGSGGIVAEGTDTATYPSYGNTILSYDNDNNLPAPVIGNGATLFLRGSYDDITPISAPQGRLTLASGDPFGGSGISGAGIIYYTPYVGNVTPVYDGSRFVPKVHAELSLQLDANAAHTSYHQASHAFDLFVVSDGKIMRLVSGPAWESFGTRPIGDETSELVRDTNGLWVNKNSMTVRFGNNSGDTLSIDAKMATFVGSFFTSADGQTEMSFGGTGSGGVAAKLLLSNAYHKKEFACRIADNTDTWTYATASWRAANGASNMRASIMSCLGDDPVVATYGAFASAASVLASVGIGLDGTGAPSGRAGVVNANTGGLVGEYRGLPGVGIHTINAIEFASGPTATFYGDSGGSYQMSALEVSGKM